MPAERSMCSGTQGEPARHDRQSALQRSIASSEGAQFHAIRRRPRVGSSSSTLMQADHRTGRIAPRPGRDPQGDRFRCQYLHPTRGRLCHCYCPRRVDRQTERTAKQAEMNRAKAAEQAQALRPRSSRPTMARALKLPGEMRRSFELRTRDFGQQFGFRSRMRRLRFCKRPNFRWLKLECVGYGPKVLRL
jgi:hypothetical protein